MVLLPEGKIINNPDTVKLIKVLPTTLNKETFVVVTKLDDDSIDVGSLFDAHGSKGLRSMPDC